MGLRKYISVLLAAVMLTLSCAKEALNGSAAATGDDDICSQVVLFSSGNVSNIDTKAPASPYMAQDGRFVCTMYYKPGVNATEETPFDIDGGTSVLTWMSVNNKYGNSVYRFGDFREIQNKEHEAYRAYGFDPDAEFFYWKNRLSHVFVAYADYNKLKTNVWGLAETQPGALFMYPEASGNKVTYREDWEFSYCYVLVNKGTAEAPDYQTRKESSYHYGTLIQYSDWYASHKDKLNDELKTELLRTSDVVFLDADGSTYRKSVWRVDFDDPDLVFCRVEKKVQTPVDTKANCFDLTRSADMNSMADQVDPILAVTVKRPDGSEQETNRVNLFFKHQFSQVQVNLSVSEGGSAGEITGNNIEKVELLGVSRRGYVFTHVTPEGAAIPADYDPVDLRSFSASQISANPYGTSFDMFVAAEADTPSTAIRSFNAIAFGMLEAIRITWNEGDGKPQHVATMAIDKDEQGRDLKHLESGTRFIYDIELKRSKVSLISTHIVPWILDDAHQFTGDGIISTTTSE